MTSQTVVTSHCSIPIRVERLVERSIERSMVLGLNTPKPSGCFSPKTRTGPHARAPIAVELPAPLIPLR